MSCCVIKIIFSTAGLLGLCGTMATEANRSAVLICNEFHLPDVKSAVEYICFLQFVQLGLSISHLIINTGQKERFLL